MERPGGIMDEGVHMLDENKGKLVGLVLDFLLLARGSTPQGAPEGVYIRLCGSSLQPTVVRNATRIDPDGEEEEEAVDEPDRRITPTRCDADGLEAAGSAAFLWRRDAAAVGIPAVRQGDTRPPVGSPAAAVMDHEACSSGVYGYARRASITPILTAPLSRPSSPRSYPFASLTNPLFLDLHLATSVPPNPLPFPPLNLRLLAPPMSYSEVDASSLALFLPRAG
ncbi:hypothetical protein BHE74_00034377 [Ensete ventricosum]|nr:hypothetical protein BHE74_00034377 [Ensete ventricosum]